MSSASAIKPGICRICTAYCQVLVHVEDDKVAKVVGDKNNTYFQGYTCPKGRGLPAQHNSKDRLLHCMKRNDSADHVRINSNLAMDEIADKIQEIVAEYGPRSVAVYGGTGQISCPVAPSVSVSFLMGLGSPMHFTSSTIDQPGKHIAMAAHGLWSAGDLHFDASG